MFKKKTPKNADKLPKPPQPQFFDEPKGIQKTSGILRDLLEKKWVRFAAIIFFAFILGVTFFSSRTHKKAKTPVLPAPEKRAEVTTATLERAIDASARTKKVKVRRPEEIRAERKKRKYDSDIAVFVEKPKDSDPGSSRGSERREKERIGLPSGTKIPALLSNRVFSFNVAAPVTAILPKDFIFNGKVVIPKDSVFLGEAAVVKSVDRINVRFDLLIFPDGREVRVKALALAEDSAAGIPGDVDKHTDQKALKAIGETLLAGASLFAGGRSTSSDPFSLQDQMRLNLSQNLTNQAAQDLRSTKIEKSITVEAYTPIQVILLDAI